MTIEMTPVKVPKGDDLDRVIELLIKNNPACQAVYQAGIKESIPQLEQLKMMVFTLAYLHEQLIKSVIEREAARPATDILFTVLEMLHDDGVIDLPELLKTAEETKQGVNNESTRTH